jgi:hypothetical protein
MKAGLGSQISCHPPKHLAYRSPRVRGRGRDRIPGGPIAGSGGNITKQGTSEP